MQVRKNNLSRATCVVFVIYFLAQPAAWTKNLDASEAVPGVVPSNSVAETDRALFLELVKLAKFNIHFHLESNRHQKWRDFTYPFGRESGTALSFAGTLIDLRQQIKGLDNPARISRSELKKAVRCSIVGNAISGGSSALELAQNTWMSMRAKQNGYSPERSLSFVKSIAANTDRLLAVRDQLVAQEQSPEKRRVGELESQLIRRIRQQLLFEFGTWSCHSRDRQWRENTFYTIDALQNFTRMSAGIFAMKAFSHPKLARDASICGLVANSAATLNPIVRNLVGLAVRKHWKHKLAGEILFERPSQSTELDELQQKLSTEAEPNWLRKVAALNHKTENMDVELDREIKDVERYRQIAQQQSISGPLIGLTGVASSTLATIAVYGYPRDRQALVHLGFAGRTTQGVGQAYALVTTPYTMLAGMIKKRQLKNRGELPSQILEERLKRLDSY